MTIQIRPASMKDAAEIARVRVTTWRATYAGIIDQGVLDRMDVEAETKKWRNGLANTENMRAFFVAECPSLAGDEPGANRPIAGYVIAGPERDTGSEYSAEIYALYVLPGFQGQGIGRSLVNRAVDWLVSRNYRTMVIYVLRDNTSARKFYEAIGGRLVREHTRATLGLVLHEVGYGYTLAEMKAAPDK